MKVGLYQIRACWRAILSFIPYPIRRFLRYALYVVCFLAGMIVGSLIASCGVQLPVYWGVLL